MSAEKYNKNKCLEIIRQFKNVQVLVVGDVMLDRFVYGSVDRISPESPVPVLNVARESFMCGGAGNALANVATLGAKGRILAPVGADEAGETLKGLVSDMGFDGAGLFAVSGRLTTEKTRFLAGHQQLLRTDYEQKAPLEDYSGFFEWFEAALEAVDVLLISDYGKLFLSRDVLQEMIGKAKAADIPVIVDPKGRDFSIYAGATVITPNKKELSEAAGGCAVDTDVEIEAAAEFVMEECAIDCVLATRSKDGISVLRKGEKAKHIQSPGAVEVFDVSGAGDTVIAVIACAVATGAALEDAAYLANIAGHIVVSKVGTAPIRAEELMEAVQERAESSGQSVYLSAEEAQEHVARWRAKGLTVGFTNGCFDIVHSGHVMYLDQARQRCDRLIVGLNHDSSVRLLKGQDRPVHDERSRATVLKGLAAVDAVVLFGAELEDEDNTAISLIEALQPDVYFKGGDYKISEIPEAPAVQAYGGVVEVMPETKGQSTTNSIQKIKTNAA